MIGRYLRAALVSSLIVGSWGCAAAHAPVTGIIYTGVKGPVTATGDVFSTKRGTAQVTSILGLFAFGDASIQQAAKEGGITKISHVDYASTQVLGIFATYTVIVYGQ